MSGWRVVAVRNKEVAASRAPRTIGRRGPIRAVSCPTNGATAKMPTLAGSTRRQASSAVYPCTFCRNCTAKKRVPTIAKPRATLARLATENTRLLNRRKGTIGSRTRSEEHTSELQSHSDLVCRLLLEKKKKY